jgi:hypothetical protein
MYEIRCSVCVLSGLTSDDRREVEALRRIHNDMVHRRLPAATVHRVRRLRRGLAVGALAPSPPAAA